MKVIIAGSRHMPSSAYPLIGQAIKASGFTVSEVVCGMAKGADALGMSWAVVNKVQVKKFPADWKTYHKGAGPIRNRQMRDYADALILFIWQNSRGSTNMLLQMQQASKPAFVIPDGDMNKAFWCNPIKT